MGLLDIDPRNDPGGYPANEPPQRYRIREVVSPQAPTVRYMIRGTDDPEYRLGPVREHLTTIAFDPVNHRFYHALAESDQLFADLCARVVQEACRWFFDPGWEPMTGVQDITLTDGQVRESIRKLDLGENKREADRAGKQRFVLSDLPWSRQRALIERLYALRREFGFEKLGQAWPPRSEVVPPPRETEPREMEE